MFWLIEKDNKLDLVWEEKSAGGVPMYSFMGDGKRETRDRLEDKGWRFLYNKSKEHMIEYARTEP